MKWHTRKRVENGWRQRRQKWPQETRANKQEEKVKERKREKKEPGGAGREHGVEKERETAGTKPMKY